MKYTILLFLFSVSLCYDINDAYNEEYRDSISTFRFISFEMPESDLKEMREIYLSTKYSCYGKEGLFEEEEWPHQTCYRNEQCLFPGFECAKNCFCKPKNEETIKKYTGRFKAFEREERGVVWSNIVNVTKVMMNDGMEISIDVGEEEKYKSWGVGSELHIFPSMKMDNLFPYDSYNVEYFLKIFNKDNGQILETNSIHKSGIKGISGQYYSIIGS